MPHRPRSPAEGLPRILAVDWSGAARGAERRLWLAEWRPGIGITRLEAGRSREALVEHLCEDVSRDPRTVLGLDFAFSFPRWFLRERALRDAPTAWALVAREGERWMADCPPPFWGRPGRTRPSIASGDAGLRRTERELPPIAGIRPKSILQLGGAGAVGTGSLRGIPHLLTLRAAGCNVWPFDPPSLPLVLEIYPRLLTGAVVKSNPAARRAYLRDHQPPLAAELARVASGSEDAFDALVSALGMGTAAKEFLSLPPARDSIARLEGEIWRPRGRANRPVASRVPSGELSRRSSSADP